MRDHYKVHRLASALGVGYPTALGHLSALWCWCIGNASDGALRRFSGAELARAALWEGKPETLIAGLIESELLDRSKQIHNWSSHGLRILNQARKRKQRFLKAERSRNVPAGKKEREKERKKVGKKEPASGFEEFWSAYPRKVGREAAERAWGKLAPDAVLLTRILAALAEQTRWPQWVKDGGQFIPHPATWLTGRRWEDQETSRPRERSVADDLTPEQRARIKQLTSGIGR